MISRAIYPTTHNTHAPGGIRTNNPSKQAAADPRRRPRGRWDRQTNEAKRSLTLEQILYRDPFILTEVGILVSYCKLSRYSDKLRAGRSGNRIPVGGKIFRTRPDRPWGPPSPLYNGYRVFPGGKAAGVWR